MIKKEKGITLVSLIITIVLMLIVSSTVIHVSLDRFEVNNLNKMKNDIELLEDKVSNYYLKYGVLPVLRDNTNAKKQYTYTTLNFQKNSLDNNIYYIIDLEAMEGISLNYGKEGYENPNTSDDVYIINELTHTIYYVKGIELDGETYHYLKITGNANDNIPPSSPQINVISGTKNAEGIYTTDVEIEIIPGKDAWSGVAGTQYSLDNGTTWKELGTSSKILDPLTEDGSYIIKAKNYDNASVPNYSAETQLTFEIRKIVVGDYVNYDVSYTDMYQGTEYTSENGWRYLGTDDSGNKLLISTAIPLILSYNYNTVGENEKWWDKDTTLKANVRATNGMLNNFDKIPFAQKSPGIDIGSGEDNTAIGAFAPSTRTYNGEEYNAVGDYFKSSTYSNKIENVRTLTLAELNKAINSATGGSREETSTSPGFKDLTDEALGLFDMHDLEGYTAEDYYYWLASHPKYYPYIVTFVSDSHISDNVDYVDTSYRGMRPVVVLSSDVEFIKEDGIWKIAD